MCDIEPKWTTEELNSDAVSKKDLVSYLQEISSLQFLQEHKLKGQLKSIVKTKGKDSLIQDYKDVFSLKAFKKEGEDEALAASLESKKEEKKLQDSISKLEIKDGGKAEAPKYKKTILKKGGGLNIPKKGDQVAIWYTGKFLDGKVFDTNVVTGRKAKSAQPLRFKVGRGSVVRGMDEVLLTMSVGEKAEVEIEPQWAYGRKGLDNVVPPNSTLVFEIELAAMD